MRNCCRLKVREHNSIIDVRISLQPLRAIVRDRNNVTCCTCRSMALCIINCFILYHSTAKHQLPWFYGVHCDKNCKRWKVENCVEKKTTIRYTPLSYICQVFRIGTYMLSVFLLNCFIMLTINVIGTRHYGCPSSRKPKSDK